SLTSGNGVTRYRSFDQLLPDQNTGLDEKSVQVARKNLHLLSDAELSDRYSSLPVVRILRDGAGRFELDQAFIPPCLTLRASATLRSLLYRLVEILDEKSTVFTQEQQQRHGV